MFNHYYNMHYLYPIFSILSWWFAPIILKYFLWDIDILILFVFILFFAWIPWIFNKNIFQLLKSKIFLLNIFIISFLTIIHYLGNFYWIIFWNIILTTLIIKNSPFFQNIIYSILYKKEFKKYNYFIWLSFILWVSLLSYTNRWIIINFLYIIIPLLSSIAWAFLMIFLSKIKNENEVFSLWNLFSSVLILLLITIFWNININLIKNISLLQYFILFILWVIPTFIAPILWAKSIKKLWNKIIFFDYLTPIITIVSSIFLFNLHLNIYNYIWIIIIITTLYILSILQKKLN